MKQAVCVARETYAPDGDRSEVVQDGVPDGGQVLGHVHSRAVVHRHGQDKGKGQDLKQVHID